jgi:positive regulator of sigma E activity
MINQRPSIEEEDKEMIHKAQQRELNVHKHEHSSCSSSDTRRICW